LILGEGLFDHRTDVMNGICQRRSQRSICAEQVQAIPEGGVSFRPQFQWRRCGDRRQDMRCI
jgi:hypothetical protein